MQTLFKIFTYLLVFPFHLNLLNQPNSNFISLNYLFFPITVIANFIKASLDNLVKHLQQRKYSCLKLARCRLLLGHHSRNDFEQLMMIISI
jgi:hypothetical protein